MAEDEAWAAAEMRAARVAEGWSFAPGQRLTVLTLYADHLPTPPSTLPPSRLASSCPTFPCRYGWRDTTVLAPPEEGWLVGKALHPACGHLAASACLSGPSEG